jgi:hypothetical protein
VPAKTSQIASPLGSSLRGNECEKSRFLFR